MKLMVEMSDEYYKVITEIPDRRCTADMLIIKNGTPLPKGHGRLIDAEALKKIIQENDVLHMAGFSVRICDIDYAPTIIEADKER